MALGGLAVLASIIALAVLDRQSGRPDAAQLAALGPRRRGSPPVALVADAGVIGTLLLWHVIGATSSDDGYNLTMARVAGQAGYVANYYRYFGTTEAPFDWYQSVLAQLASVSTAGVWMRLPATLAAIGTLADHQPLHAATAGPRPGRAGRQPGGGVDGGRGVPGRLAAVQQRPAARAADRAGRGGHLGAGRDGDRHPSAGAGRGGDHRGDADRDAGAAGLDRGRRPARPRARPIARIILRRKATDGLLAPLAVLAASLSLITIVVFRSQTLATVAESARIKYKVGPTIAWYQEFLRYYFLTVESNAEGSMTRRFAVLIMLLCLFGVLVVLLRRGRLPVWPAARPGG